MDRNIKIKKGNEPVPYQEFNGKKYYLYEGERYYSKSDKRLHRVVWEYYNGKIPKGYHIHHIDGDCTNNNISNLQLIEDRKHLRYEGKKRFRENKEWFKEFHKSGIEAAKEWHKSKEGYEWHKEHAKKYNFGHFEYEGKECEVCKKIYIAKKKSQKFCSNNCKAKYRRDNKIDHEKRQCILCKKEFECGKYTKQKLCSSSCSAKYRSNRK